MGEARAEIEAQVERRHSAFLQALGEKEPRERLVFLLGGMIRSRLNYASIARQLVEIQPLPPGAMVCYDIPKDEE